MTAGTPAPAAPGALRALAGAVPLPLLVTDARSRLLAVNPAAEALFGPGLVGRPFVTVIRQPAINDALEAVLAGGAGASLRATISADGRDHPVEAQVAPLDDAARPAVAAVTLTDLSGLENAEQLRRDFVANVSHELRTPLTALLGFIETLQGPARGDAAARERFLGIMDREAQRMNRLVADLLSLSRVEQDEHRRPAGTVELTGLVRSVITLLSPAAEAAGAVLTMHPEAAPDGPVTVPGEHDQLVQVVQNLVENAIKYGSAGGRVTVALRPVEHEPVLRGPAWAITVEDRGEGIDPLHLPRLTERFYRVDTHRARAQGGTGLGLAIVKHIVNRHRGRLRVESTPGEGSRFSVILPAGPRG